MARQEEIQRLLDELRGADFAAKVLESPNDLSWLIEHCLSTRTKESIETALRRKDGGRLLVRLSACASASSVASASSRIARSRGWSTRTRRSSCTSARRPLGAHVAFDARHDEVCDRAVLSLEREDRAVRRKHEDVRCLGQQPLPLRDSTRVVTPLVGRAETPGELLDLLLDNASRSLTIATMCAS